MKLSRLIYILILTVKVVPMNESVFGLGSPIAPDPTLPWPTLAKFLNNHSISKRRYFPVFSTRLGAFRRFRRLVFRLDTDVFFFFFQTPALSKYIIPSDRITATFLAEFASYSGGNCTHVKCQICSRHVVIHVSGESSTRAFYFQRNTTDREVEDAK